MTKSELQAKCDALEAQLAIARTLYKELRDSVKLVTAPANRYVATPVVTKFKDALGREWVKERIGRVSKARLVVG
jgi:hypothetical protein